MQSDAIAMLVGEWWKYVLCLSNFCRVVMVGQCKRDQRVKIRLASIRDELKVDIWRTNVEEEQDKAMMFLIDYLQSDSVIEEAKWKMKYASKAKLVEEKGGNWKRDATYVLIGQVGWDNFACWHATLSKQEFVILCYFLRRRSYWDATERRYKSWQESEEDGSGYCWT